MITETDQEREEREQPSLLRHVLQGISPHLRTHDAVDVDAVANENGIPPARLKQMIRLHGINRLRRAETLTIRLLVECERMRRGEVAMIPSGPTDPAWYAAIPHAVAGCAAPRPEADKPASH